jgi:hypothetical protein
MDQKQIGYFYFYKRCLLGEIHSPDTTPVYKGHHAFWTNEASKVFCTSDMHAVLQATYGCDRGQITYQYKRYMLLGTPAIINNRDKILQLFRLTKEDSVILIANDDHYKSTQDQETLKNYWKCFKVPKRYKYLIGRT